MNEKSQRFADRVIWIVAICFIGLFSFEAFADVPVTVQSPAGLDAYRAECGACHIAYPPRLLPQPSWQKLMGGLEKHFGVDASLDTTTAHTISEFLARNAGSDRYHALSGSEPPLRITETAWFRHEHDEIPPNVWKRKSVGSPSNCTACHADAAQGRFNEHTVRIPRE